MNRRSFLGALVAAIPASKIDIQPATPKRWGLLTVERYWALREAGCDLEVFLDGKPVPECVAADDIEGWAERHFLDGDDLREAYVREHVGPLLILKRGHVEFRRRA